MLPRKHVNAKCNAKKNGNRNAMGLVKTTYLADNYQDRYGIVVNQSTLDLVIDGRSNDSAGGEYIDSSPIQVTGSRRGKRDYARLVVLSRTSSEGMPQGQRVLFRLPWLRPEGFSDFLPDVQGTYKGSTVYVVGRVYEKLV
jgi:hypothetical protein